MFRGGLEWWHIVILLLVIFVLFGYKKLPSATKSIAQSLKIFRDETKGLRGDDEHNPASPGEHVSGTSSQAAIPAPAVTVPPAPAPVTVRPAPVQQEQSQATVPVPAGPAPDSGQHLAPQPKSR